MTPIDSANDQDTRLFVKSFLTRVLHDCFKLTYAYLNERDKVYECYSCLKMIIYKPIYMLIFVAKFFSKRGSLKQFYL